MYLTPSKCPICGETLLVTRLICPACDTGIQGRFQFSRIEQLNPDQLAFVELFVRCEGKLNWVAQELKISYPTVRARLEEAIRGMGYEVRDAPPAEERQRHAEQRQAILDDLAVGKITSVEAVRQLQSI
ncbi:MAG: hypothetical protein AUK03_17155 [Anaerolineae bacterium CG2_30_64_16]|nr:MAG: hypothetical protein AUK03_17155 [Anaerolineae bacterium CG2_30_64_16]